MFHSTMQDALRNGEPVTEPVPFSSSDCEEIEPSNVVAFNEFPGELQLEGTSESVFSPEYLKVAADMAIDHGFVNFRLALANTEKSADLERLLFIIDHNDPSRAVAVAPRIQHEGSDDA